MKKLKLFIWIFALSLAELWCTSHIRIFGAVPALTFAFLVCVSICDDEFHIAAVTGALCGIFAGSLFGRSFGAVFAYYALSAIAVFILRKKPRYTHGAVKSSFLCLILTALFEFILLLAGGQGLRAQLIIRAVVPAPLCCAAAAALIYPLIVKTVYNKERQKKLIS